MQLQAIFSRESGLGRLSLFLYTGVFILLLYDYTLIMEELGGFSTRYTGSQYIELALVVYLYGLFYAILKPVTGRAVLAGLPILLTYVVHDVFLLAFGKVFRLINVLEIPELLQILPLSYAALLAAVTLTPIGLYLAMVDYRRPKTLILWLLPLSIVCVFANNVPSAFASNFKQVAAQIVKYSDKLSVENNGRIAMMLYRELQRQDALNQLQPYRDRAAYNQQSKALADELHVQSNQRNVHLIVLESFLDPRLFRDLKFSQPPAHPSFDKLFGDTLGLSLAPVFGGATAQAEFEVLCGVPAFEQLSSIEFNVFTGAQAHCLPSRLRAIGYRSVASNSYKPNFFNALPGCIGMGFDECYFPQEFSRAHKSYLRFGEPGIEEYLFDHSLFEQNLGLIKAHLKQSPGKPLFNYVLTVYGHTPHILDPEQRPEVIKIESSYPDDHLERAVNQFYYRTQAIAHYVNQLLALDGDSLIILISDHVPPLRNGPDTYQSLHYMDNKEKSYYHNRLAVIENGKAKVYPTMRHFDLPPLVYNYLSNGKYCQQHACAFREAAQRQPREAYLDEYLRLMAHASE